jgi:hypothetical protein
MRTRAPPIVSKRSRRAPAPERKRVATFYSLRQTGHLCANVMHLSPQVLVVVVLGGSAVCGRWRHGRQGRVLVAACVCVSVPGRAFAPRTSYPSAGLRCLSYGVCRLQVGHVLQEFAQSRRAESRHFCIGQSASASACSSGTATGRSACSTTSDICPFGYRRREDLPPRACGRL